LHTESSTSHSTTSSHSLNQQSPPSTQCKLQVPLPVQATSQSPWQVTSQSPALMHSTWLPEATSTTQSPELSQVTWQAVSQVKLQLPEPAQVKSQSVPQ
jgi:hypothetical protein